MSDDQKRAVAIAATYSDRAAHCRERAAASNDILIRSAYTAMAYSYSAMAKAIPLLPDLSTLPEPSRGSNEDSISMRAPSESTDILERRRKDGSDLD